MQRHGWVLLFHGRIAEQLRKLRAEVDCAQPTDPGRFQRNPNVKLFRALSQLMLETIPRDPTRGWLNDTPVRAQRYWRRAKIGQRVSLRLQSQSCSVRMDRRTKWPLLAADGTYWTTLYACLGHAKIEPEMRPILRAAASTRTAFRLSARDLWTSQLRSFQQRTKSVLEVSVDQAGPWRSGARSRRMCCSVPW